MSEETAALMAAKERQYLEECRYSYYSRKKDGTAKLKSGPKPKVVDAGNLPTNSKEIKKMKNLLSVRKHRKAKEAQKYLSGLAKLPFLSVADLERSLEWARQVCSNCKVTLPLLVDIRQKQNEHLEQRVATEENQHLMSHGQLLTHIDYHYERDELLWQLGAFHRLYGVGRKSKGYLVTSLAMCRWKKMHGHFPLPVEGELLSPHRAKSPGRKQLSRAAKCDIHYEEDVCQAHVFVKCPVEKHCQSCIKKFKPIDDDILVVGPSRIAGIGVFASADIEPGSKMVLQYTGKVLTDISGLADTSYVVDCGSGRFIDGKHSKGKHKFFNHSCNPNMRAQKFVGPSGETGMILMVTEAGVSKGDEMTWDYGPDHPVMRICRCGSHNCRNKNN